MKEILEELQVLFEESMEEFNHAILRLFPIPSITDLKKFQKEYPGVVKAIIITYDLE